MTVLPFDAVRLKPALEQELDPAQVVIGAVLRHVEIVARAVDYVEEMGELVHAQAIEVGVYVGVGAHIVELSASLMLLDRPYVKEELLAHKA